MEDRKTTSVIPSASLISDHGGFAVDDKVGMQRKSGVGCMVSQLRRVFAGCSESSYRCCRASASQHHKDRPVYNDDEI